MKLSSKHFALTSVIAACYAILVLAFAGISFGLIQIRIADALIPLSILYGWPVVMGVTIGGAVANVVSTSPSVVMDISLGAAANFLASLLAWRISRLRLNRQSISEFIGCAIATFVVTAIVGTYLAILSQMEIWLWWLGVGVGSLVSILILGFFLIQIMKRRTSAVTT